jgi:hypothetical protein
LFKGGDNYKNAKTVGKGQLKISSRTTEPEKLRFILKFSDVLQDQVSSNHAPLGAKWVHNRENGGKSLEIFSRIIMPI